MAAFAIVVTLIAIVVLRSVIVVPADSVYVVERLGRYHTTLPSGLHVLMPFLDRVAFRYSLVPQDSELSDVCISRDNIAVTVTSTFSWQISHPELAAYQTANPVEFVRELLKSCQRQTIGERSFNDVRETTRELQSDVLRAVTQPAGKAGVKVMAFNIQRVDRVAAT